MPSNKHGNTIRIGITGGIGSGKTLASKYFEKLGYKVIYADVIAKKFYKTSPGLKKKLVSAFGKEILDQNGNISGSASRRIIFSSKKNIKRVNSIVHPFVIKEIDRQTKNSKKRIVFVETAIMFESGYSKRLDYSILIYANKELRVKRVKKRDKMPVRDIRNLMSIQMDEREKLEKADFVIKNNSAPKELYKNIKSLSKILTRL